MIAGLVKAELLLRYWWFKNNKSFLAVSLLWPYVMVVTVLALGLAYGSLEVYKARLGVVDPLVYLFSASAVAFTTVNVIDYTVSVATWHRWIGTLQYVSLAPVRLGVYVVVSGLASSLLSAGITWASVAPAIAILSGPEGLARFAILALAVVAGMIPLVAIGCIAAMATLALKEEGNVIGFLMPLLLLLSGVFYPVEVLPWVLRLMSNLTPSYYVVEASKIVNALNVEAGFKVYLVIYALALLAVLYNLLGFYFAVWAESRVKSRGVIE